MTVNANPMMAADERRGRKTEGYLFKRGKTWWACWTYQGERYRESTGKSVKSEAEAVLEQKIAPFRQQDKVDALATLQSRVDRERIQLERLKSAGHHIPLADVWEKFPYNHSSNRRGTIRKLSPRNIEENRGGWNRFVRYMAKHHPDVQHMDEVDEQHAMAYSQYLREEQRLTDGRHNKLVLIARVMFVRSIGSHPFAAVPRYEVRYESRESLEEDQLRLVCSKATGELRTLFAIMLYTGLRLGDASTLRWESIKKGVIHRVMAKTHKEVAFPVHPELQHILDETPASQRKGFICPDTATQYERAAQVISDRIREHFEACKITCTQERKAGRRRISRFGAHSFRHTFVTLCARAAVPQGLVRQWVGHASEEVTRIYEHWEPSKEKQRILDALPSVMSAPSSSDVVPTNTLDLKVTLTKARELIKGMTPKNWRQVRADLAKVLGLSLPA